MYSKEPPTPTIPAADRVRLSPYVNEPYPNWEEMLSAHDVARLTRRPRWMVLSLTVLGRFPRRRRFRGRDIGWLRSDVLTWLATDLRNTQIRGNPVSVAWWSRRACQKLLPIKLAPGSRTARRSVRSCLDPDVDSPRLGDRRWRSNTRRKTR
jgi:predicted DNA-binding transcriptional regulator AlpA